MVPDLTHAVIVRPHETEQVGLAHGGAFRLLADASATGGTLGANVLPLAEGADGPPRTTTPARRNCSTFSAARPSSS
jgi:hypothetical protein